MTSYNHWDTLSDKDSVSLQVCLLSLPGHQERARDQLQPLGHPLRQGQRLPAGLSLILTWTTGAFT